MSQEFNKEIAQALLKADYSFVEDFNPNTVKDVNDNTSINDIIEKGNGYIKNFNTMFEESFKYWLTGLIGMVISNLLIIFLNNFLPPLLEVLTLNILFSFIFISYIIFS